MKSGRVGVLKMAAVFAVAAMAVGVYFVGRGQSAATNEGYKRPPTMVTLGTVEERDFEESIFVDGTINARFYSLVSPRIEGIIDDIFVREGDKVEAHKTKLFQTDSVKLKQNVELAQQALIIAQSTLDEKKASLEKAEADLSQAKKDFTRSVSLYEKKVVTLSEHEVAETKVLQLTAAKKLADTQITLAEQGVRKAEISLAMAEQDYRDSTMHAPIGGVVSARNAEPGEMGKTSNPIVRIDDVDQLKAVAYLPGQYYARIVPGKTNIEVKVLEKRIGEFPVTYRAPGIDSALRTFEIWANLPGDGEYAVPGAQAFITVVLNRTRGIGVPKEALQNRSDKYWVFVPNGDQAKMVEVRPGMDTNGWVEVLEGNLKPGDKVITQGQFLLEDGYPIRVQGVEGNG